MLKTSSKPEARRGRSGDFPGRGWRLGAAGCFELWSPGLLGRKEAIVTTLGSEQIRGSLSFQQRARTPGSESAVCTGHSWHRGRPSAACLRVAQHPLPQSYHPRAAAGMKEIRLGEAAVPDPGAPGAKAKR